MMNAVSREMREGLGILQGKLSALWETFHTLASKPYGPIPLSDVGLHASSHETSKTALHDKYTD